MREYHVDGFRFDLAPVLSRAGGALREEGSLIDEIGRDPVLSEVKLIAEPWDLGPGGYRAGTFPPPFREHDDRYRDGCRRFWNLAGPAGELSTCLTEWHERPPVQLITCHDGFTLQDLVSFSRKHNHANGEDGRDGRDDEVSCNWGVEGPTEDGAVHERRRRVVRALLGTLFLSRGVPMLLAGDEIGRSQGGNNNAYCQDGPVSWLDWSGAGRRHVQLIGELVALRRALRGEVDRRVLAEQGAVVVARGERHLVLANGRTEPIAPALPPGPWRVRLDTSDTLPVGGPCSLVPELALLVVERSTEEVPE